MDVRVQGTEHLEQIQVTPSVDVVVAVEIASVRRGLRRWRQPGGAVPGAAALRRAGRHRRTPALGLRSQRASRNRRGKDTDHGRGAAGERIGRDARAKSPSTPPATRFVRFREQIPVAAQSAGPANARRPGGRFPTTTPAGGRLPDPGARTSGHAGKGPSAIRSGAIPEGPAAPSRGAGGRRRRRRRTQSASCGRGRSAPVPGRHRRLTTVPFGDHCKRGGRAEPLARNRIPAGAGSARVSARQALIPTGRDEHDGKEKQRQGRALERQQGGGRRTRGQGTEKHRGCGGHPSDVAARARPMVSKGTVGVQGSSCAPGAAPPT